MVLFKALQLFLLPTVFIFVLILVGLILILRKKREKVGKILITVGLLFYYIFSITPTTDLILIPLENQYGQFKEDKLFLTDKIVLLSGSDQRLSEVLRIYNERLKLTGEKMKVIISGRNPLNSERNEAEEYKNYLRKQGIPSENITLEEESRNTAESAKNIKEILDDEPFFLVTSAFHMPRSIEVFQKMKTNPIPAPTDFKAERNYGILDFFPGIDNFEKSDLALHEYFGILFYRLYYY